VAANASTWEANPIPLLVPASSFMSEDIPVVAIAAGGLHSLVMTADGHVWSFGSNLRGQLGIKDQYEVWGGVVSTPTLVVLPGITEDEGVARHIFCGGRHTFVQTRADKIYGFGSNFYGQLAGVDFVGNSINEPFEITSAAKNWSLFNDSQPVEFSLGSRHSLVRTAAGTVWLFGSNRSWHVPTSITLRLFLKGFLCYVKLAPEHDHSRDLDTAARCKHSMRIYCTTEQHVSRLMCCFPSSE
jgi:alpha-tubulin suppressor-like RCC1 family protein